MKLASPIHLLHEQGPPFKLIYHAPSGRPTGPLPEHIHDPHSAWYGEQAARTRESIHADHELTVLTQDEWELEGRAVMNFIAERWGM